MGFRVSPIMLLILAYVPGALLPLVMMYSRGLGSPVIVWFFMLFWVIYVFMLLVTAYLTSRRGVVRNEH